MLKKQLLLPVTLTAAGVCAILSFLSLTTTTRARKRSHGYHTDNYAHLTLKPGKHIAFSENQHVLFVEKTHQVAKADLRAVYTHAEAHPHEWGIYAYNPDYSYTYGSKVIKRTDHTPKRFLSTLLGLRNEVNRRTQLLNSHKTEEWGGRKILIVIHDMNHLLHNDNGEVRDILLELMTKSHHKGVHIITIEQTGSSLPEELRAQLSAHSK